MTDSEGNLILGEMDPATGETPEEKQIKFDAAYRYAKVGSGPETPLLYNADPNAGDGILTVSPRDGKMSFVLNFTGTSYSNVYSQMYLKDFKMLPDGSYLMLYMDSSERPLPRAALDRLTVSEVEKTPIVLRGQFYGDTWISAQAARFNQQSDKYHVIVEDCGSGNDQEDFARLTSVQIAAGKGPDIIGGALMEDYLPCAFGIWREGDRIYGITPLSWGLDGYMMDASLLDREEEPGIQELVDALLSLGRTDAVFLSGYNSQDLLNYFLGGSEALWGMVDWEEGTCDFSGELFADILEAAALYGDSPRKADMVSIAEHRFQGSPLNLFAFQGSKEMEKAGKVVCGSQFDDGCHLRLYSDSTMAINRNSANKEGAWEFLLFLFSEEVQLYQDSYFPVRKDCLDAWLKAQLDKVETTRSVWEKNGNGESILVVYPYTDEYNTGEKAADYFRGGKSAEAVSEVIEKRVQIYLDENR
ncbi:MAG: hypothetical protein K2K63_17135 [Acetatifactor sp.]|nr:hypothetical protein [Acetatifactor sp.]